MPAVLFVPNAPVGWALAIFSLAYFGQQSWSTLVMILPADICSRATPSAPSPAWSASAARWAASCSARSSATCSTRGFGYGVVFAIAGSLHVLALRRHLPGRAGRPARRDAAVRLPFRDLHEDHEGPHPRRRVARQDRAAAAAFLHQPDGPAGSGPDPRGAGVDVDLHLPRLADRRGVHRQRPRRHRQRRAVAATSPRRSSIAT